MTLTFKTPHDETDFAELPDEAKADVRRRHRAVASIVALRTQGKGMRAKIAETTATSAAALGLTVKRLQNLVTEFLASGCDWKVLLNTARWKLDDETTLPAAFVQEWKRRCERHHGGVRSAHAELMRDWRAWRRATTTKGIPGYENAPEPRPCGTEPRGWTYRNLLRYAPTPGEMKIMQRGLGAARSLMPQVLTSRVHLAVGQRYEFDDFRSDLKVVYGTGQMRQSVEPWRLSVLDVHSAAVPLCVHKPAWRRGDGTVDGIKDAHMRLFLAAFLTRCGWHPGGAQFVAEHGTAKIDEGTADLLAHYDAGLKVDRSGSIGDRQAVPGWFAGKGRGNPNKKPHLESLHNLLVNSMGALPGQTGAIYTERPEWLEGMEAEEKAIAKLMLTLPPERAALLKSPLLDFGDYVRIANDLLHFVNTRRDHRLEGWEQYLVSGFRFGADDDFLTLDDVLALPGDLQRQLRDLSERAPAIHTARVRMSPWEVWTKAAPGLRRLSGWQACELIASDAKAADAARAVRPRKLAGAYFVISDTRLALLSEPAIYEARVLGVDGTVRELADGEYQLIFNAFAPETIFVRDPKGRFLGVAPRVERINPNDREEVLAAFGYQAQRTAERLAPQRARHADEAREQQARRDLNKRIANGLPVTPGERIAAAADGRAARDNAAHFAAQAATLHETATDNRTHETDNDPDADAAAYFAGQAE